MNILLRTLKAFVQFEKDLSKLIPILPKTVKVHVTEDLMPWLEVVRGCFHADADIDMVRRALWQAGLYQDPSTPTGEPQ